MKTKITLTINGVVNELASDCLKNWDEVTCDYKRSNFSGVVRSFSSTFEFVKDAYDMLLEAYLRDGVRAEGAVAIYLLNNDWSWRKEFEAALNFSTVTWDDYTFSINCIDDSLAALINSRKSTKYEFVIGKDIESDKELSYDRVKLLNTVTHCITGDETSENGYTIIRGPRDVFRRLPTYIMNDDELFLGSPIIANDESNDPGSSFITVNKDVSEINIHIDIWTNVSPAMDIHLFEFDEANPDMNDSYKDLGQIFKHDFYLGAKRECLGTFESIYHLKKLYPTPPANSWAMVKNDTPSDGEILVGGYSAFFAPDVDTDDDYQWTNGSFGLVWHPDGGLEWGCDSLKIVRHFNLKNLTAGKKYALFCKLKASSASCIIKSTIKTQWLSRANTISIDTITPAQFLKTLLRKIVDNRISVAISLSDYDARLANTRLLAAESIRGIKGAKIYSTFNDFCDWMETVFGYVYTIEDPTPPQYKTIQKMTSIVDDYSYDVGDIHGRVVDDYCPDGLYDEAPFFVRSHNCFCVQDTKQTWNMYKKWNKSDAYNDSSGKARADVVFDSGSHHYYFEDDELREYYDDVDDLLKQRYPLRFMHRSELFKDEEQGIVLHSITQPKSKVDSGILYSSVEVGYKKQDYETRCGRDEWNFMNYYTTGIDVTDKKLTLQSKYRADCYGVEFLSQKRNQDTTDNDSDNDIFFVMCKTIIETDTASRGDTDETASYSVERLVIDRSTKVEGALTDTVFNGEFSPYYCIKANEGYISAMAPNMELQFASSDGNSDIVVDGAKTTENIPLGKRLFSEIQMDFTTTGIDQTVDFSKLVKVVNKGLVYTGFLQKTECCYARPSEVDYTLIIKDIKQI